MPFSLSAALSFFPDFTRKWLDIGMLGVVLRNQSQVGVDVGGFQWSVYQIHTRSPYFLVTILPF